MACFQPIYLLLEGGFVQGFKLGELSCNFPHNLLLPILKILTLQLLNIPHPTNPLQLHIQKQKPILLDHRPQKIPLPSPEAIQQEIRLNPLAPLITKIEYISHLAILKNSVDPATLLHIAEAAFAVEDVLFEVAFVEVVVFEDPHPVALEHVVLVEAALGYF